MTVRYHDRTPDGLRPGELAVRNDVLDVEVPARPAGDPDGEQPALTVTVNTDAIVVSRGGCKVAAWAYADLLANAADDYAEWLKLGGEG
jgi:hypothetical protein